MPHLLVAPTDKRAQTNEIQAIGVNVFSKLISYSCIKPFAKKQAL